MRRLAALAAAALGLGCTIDTRVATIRADGGGDDGIGRAPFALVHAGEPLPDDETCARLVTRSSWEPRPANATANHRVPAAAELAKVDPFDGAHGYDDKADALRARVTGSFTGTTDEILQWIACKWGFEEDYVRAEAVEQSGWTQGVRSDWTSTTSECPADAATRTMNGAQECAQTYGIMQVVWKYHKSAWPLYRDSTAFHLDYVYALRRACYEGWDKSQATRVADGAPPYAADDVWGCMGVHFSGTWYDDAAKAYVTRVKGQYQGRAWTHAGF